MLRTTLRCLVLFVAWASVRAAEPTEVTPIPIGGYRHYVLLPVTAPDFKPHRGLLQNVSDRLLGRMAPLLNQWNYSEQAAKTQNELAIALVLDQSSSISGGARVMWGPLAGGADIAAHVDLLERPTGKLIGRQTFDVVKKQSWGTNADYLLYDELVSQVVGYLADCHAIEMP